MKRADIKVGETYGVRLKASKHSTVVPATVVSIDAPVFWKEWQRWGNREETITQKTGGIVVRFAEPTRVSNWAGFSLASKTNENAGDIEETYSFHDYRNGKGIAKLFVGPWEDIEAERRENEEAERQAYADANARADKFEPKLGKYLGRLAALGIRAELHTDSSGIYGGVDRRLSTAYIDKRYNSRPTGFHYEDVRVDPQVFEFLLQQAEATGVTYKRDFEYEEEEE